MTIGSNFLVNISIGIDLPWNDSATKTNFLMNRYAHFHSNISHDLLNQSIQEFQYAENLESPFVVSSDASAASDLLMQQLDASINQWFQNEVGDTDLLLFPYRYYYYDLKANSSSLSNKWHYDLEVPQYCFFVMLYLNDSPGFGTGVYPFPSSRAISEANGYISTPTGYRASSLDVYHPTLNIDAPNYIRPKAGDILAFSPSRCLHKGFVPLEPVDYSRKVLHISYSMFSKSDSIADFDCESLDLSTLSKRIPVGRSFAPYWSGS